MTEQSVVDSTSASGASPAKPLLVLTGLILAAGVANVNLAVANVALPTIGTAFDASQTQLNLVAVGYSLGLAASVLYLGAVGDRYGRKLMLLIGTACAVPLSVLAAYAPSSGVLVAARILGGVTGGLCYPTTLALIAALWSGPARTKAIALWSAVGAAFVAGVGPLVAGILLEHYWWGSVFLLTIPIAVVAFVMCWLLVPAHINENTRPVDNLGGVLSVVLVGSLILALNFAVVPGSGVLVLCLAVVTIVGLVLFVVRQRRVANPLYDLHVAARPTFWVAALAGMVVFGSLMGAVFVGQQFLQNVLGYSTVQAGAAALPAAVLLVVVAPFSARLVVEIGSRLTLLVGYAGVFLGFVTMLLLWGEGTAYWKVALAYALVGIGVGFASTPAAHSLTGSVPTTRVGMASGTADLQRDLGGAVMQSICGALLTAGYASAFAASIAASPGGGKVSDATESQLTKSFASAEAMTQQYPKYSQAITSAAKSAFLDGSNWAYAAGLIAVACGAALVFFCFPHKDDEATLVAGYHAADGESDDHAAGG